MYLLDVLTIPKDDPIAFTFFTGYMAMLAASVFFFFERGSVESKWKLSMLVSGLITGIAAVHYYYMRDYYAWLQEISPLAPALHVDWTLNCSIDVCRILFAYQSSWSKNQLTVEAYWGISSDACGRLHW